MQEERVGLHLENAKINTLNTYMPMKDNLLFTDIRKEEGRGPQAEGFGTVGTTHCARTILR